ncbi:hypothetical protein BBK82_05090 [Lentzea guizhouensis]|uniref:HNH domain-containing protein n=1 Tax=Lentzea guizhouensis TaxID=1586287 RepID=A0A1B2HCW1_9PSEU|nr:hypothetical protein [Lentzea guizhouensis]ANZ35548.1 hypothetical protein BBK82_05090 [Lentzea guizhouensis]
MAYTLHDDNVASDARWVTLAKLQETDGVPDLLALSPSRRRKYLARLEVRKALMIAAYFVMQSESARNTADGYITQEAALACCTEPWILQALLTPVCGKPPLLHQEGQKCGEKNCIDASGPWKPNYEYRVCAFLKRNPSKSEQDRRKQQRAELTDSTLRTAVYLRDGGCCRYCRSGPLGRKGMGNAKDRRRIPQIDHIDPDEPAGPGPDYKGVALSCAACNEYKQKRTPEEADMDLLPEPTPEQIAYWAERGEQQFSRAPRGTTHPADLVPDEWLAARDNPPDNEINNAADNAQTTSRTTSPTVVDHVVPGRPEHIPDAPDAPAADLVSAGGAQDNARDNPPEPSGSGRVGHTQPEVLQGSRGQPIRTPDAPDIYHGRSRTAPTTPSTPPPSRREGQP